MQKIEAIDLFCGVGGLTYGLREAGLTVLAGLDSDETCQHAYTKNSDAEFISADIAQYDFSELEELFSEDSVRVLVGCAPCQPFSSHAHKAKRRENDDRWNLIEYFIEAVKIVNPSVVSMENVRGLLKTDIFKQFTNSLKALDYELDYKVVNCPDYGIPQARSRLVLIGSKIGKIKIPKATHKKEEYSTVADIIRQLPHVEAGMTCPEDSVHKAKNLFDINLERIRHSKPKGTWRDWPEALLPECYRRPSGATYSSVYGRMSWNDVSPTITTQFCNYGSGRFGHPEQDRALTLREGALLQTFPIDYDFGENFPIATLSRHIGNAVPPRLGQVIGMAIKEHINEHAQ